MSINLVPSHINNLTSLFRLQGAQGALYVFEIYPQREAPELAKIAEFIPNLHEQGYITYALNGNRVVIYGPKNGTVIVWDFMENTVVRWSVGRLRIMDQVGDVFLLPLV